MTKEKIERVDIDAQEIEALLKCAKEALPAGAFSKIEQIVRAYLTMMRLVEDHQTTMARLRQMLFGASTESLSNVLKKLDPEAAAAQKESKADGETGQEEKPVVKGHGRNGASEYRAAKKVKVPLAALKPGQCCPGCLKGKLYDNVAPGQLVRVTGQAPLTAVIYELEKLRCNLCGEIFTAQTPASIGTEKYDASAGAMIAILKYGTGMPFNRLDQLQDNLGIPLAATTQWEIVEGVAEVAKPVFEELRQQAAQGEVLHNDDTNAKILELCGKRSATEQEERAESTAAEASEDPERSGIFTSGLVAIKDEHKMALFCTGRKHAGENLADLLKKRSAELPPPIQMCDALSRNVPEFATILANCNSHARRKFVDIAPNFPEDCLHVLEVFRQVYAVDDKAKKLKLSATDRLALHQEQSAQLMSDLFAWMQAQIDAKKVEPNSGLGQAMGYVRKHWKKLTLFLQVAGAPLDNNLCERALKKAILHRKNAYFYKTRQGARVGDLLMSLIYTCHLCGANSFDYLVALQNHQAALATTPSDWLPWNYSHTMAALAVQPSLLPP